VNGYLRLYVNGVQVASRALTGNITPTTDGLNIGGDFANEFFAGLIDEVRIYDYARTQSQIQTDMVTPILGSTVVTVTAPADGSTVSGNVTVTATAHSSVGINNVQFQLDGANLGAPITSTPYSLTWDTTTVSNGAHVLTAVATDANGNATTSGPVNVIVANTVSGPTVTSHTPTSGAAGVATNTPVKATFNESVIASSIGFTLKDGSGNAVAATVAYDDPSHTVTLTPNALLVTGTTFTATVSGAKDAAGNVMPSPVSWSFTTEAAPALTGETPAPGATNVPTTTPVSATFNKSVVASTLAFALKDAAGNAVATSLSYNDSTHTATWTPAALANNATYTATVSAAKDASGNALAAPVS
jgi:hypothetical protein